MSNPIGFDGARPGVLLPPAENYTPQVLYNYQ
jgi:hypothetical protein